MISQKTLDALKGIGLNLYERKLYAALLARGTSTAGELSEMAGVPRSRSYDVLESLADKGFVIVQHAKPLRYVSVPPEEAMERCKNRLKEKLSTHISRIEDFKMSDALSELNDLHSQGVSLVDSADLSGSLKGRYALHQQVETMLKNANESIDIITSEQGLREIYTTHSGLIQSAADKGIQVRIAAPITEKNREAAEALSSVAELKDLSVAQDLPVARMFLSDSKEVVMALTDDAQTHQSQDISFWTSSDHFGKAFAKPTFEMIWKSLD